MKLWSDSFKDGGVIPGPFAFCVIDPTSHVALSANKNPHLAWSELPVGAKSLALICHDMDVPSRGDDVNQDGKTVPVDLPRVDFFHWTLVDLPADLPMIEVGQYSNAVTPRGKAGPEIGCGQSGRHGMNDFTHWFAGDEDMSGDYFGYDGPCPPWNDAVIHRYVFTVFALDIERVPLEGKFSGQQVRDAIRGHILDQANLVGIYTLNPLLAGPSYGTAESV